MTIERDGKQIELTPKEIREAAWEYQKECRVEDISEYLVEERNFDRSLANRLARKMEPVYESYIDNSDSNYENMVAAIDDWFEDAEMVKE